MSLSEVIENASTVCVAAGYKKADYRTPLEKQSMGGVDRHFQVTAEVASLTLARHAQPNAFGDIRSAVVTVRVAFSRFGGDKGGSRKGGDAYDVNVRAFDDMIVLCPRLESQEHYDAQNTGLRRRVLEPTVGFRQSFQDDRMEIWDAVFNCEFEEIEDRRAVA